MNVKKIVVCDPDTFSTSNLNRQLYSNINNIGQYKTDVAKQRAIDLRYKGEFVSYSTLFETFMLDGIDVVIDCLDSIKDRLTLEDLCSERNIPLIHGAVEGNTYQVGVSLKGKNLLHNIYKDVSEPSKKETNVLTVQICAAKQVSLALRQIKEHFEVGEI